MTTALRCNHLTAMQAHNGSGKTTCFALAMLSRVDAALQCPQALCVCPTRELVVQNLGVVQRLGKYTSISATSTARTDFQLTRSGDVCFKDPSRPLMLSPCQACWPPDSPVWTALTCNQHAADTHSAKIEHHVHCFWCRCNLMHSQHIVTGSCIAGMRVCQSRL